MLADFAAFWNFLTKEWPRQSGGYVAPGAKPRILPYRWIISGLLLLLFSGYLYYLSFNFTPETPHTSLPIVAVVVTMICAGLTFLFMVELCRFVRPGKGVIIWIVLLGLVLRLMMLLSNPILEVDFYRYQWDGAVTANGLNPYRFAPEAIVGGAVIDPVYKEVFDSLLIDSDGVINKINHGQVRSIYPPVTQFCFAVAYWLSPWKLIGLRIVLLFFEIITAILLLMLLWKLGFSPVWLLIYWLNPLVVKEILNSGHMDALLFPFVLAAILAEFRQRSRWSMVFLALATAVKVWPVLLLPIFLRRAWPDWRKLLKSSALYISLTSLLFLPILFAGFGDDSGFLAYSQRWQLNDSIFKLLLWGAEVLLPLLDLHSGHAQSFTRVLCTLLVLAVVAANCWQNPESPRRFLEAMIWVVAALFFLSPTQFPWYAVWLMPLLVLVPKHSLLLLSLLMPFYYLRYWFDAAGSVHIFDNYVVWIQFVPVWWFLLREKQLGRRIDNGLKPHKIFD